MIVAYISVLRIVQTTHPPAHHFGIIFTRHLVLVGPAVRVQGQNDCGAGVVATAEKRQTHAIFTTTKLSQRRWWHANLADRG
jgi:hypothetical protein